MVIDPMKIGFLQGCVPGKTTYALLDGSIPMCIQAALSRLSGFKNKTHAFERDKRW